MRMGCDTCTVHKIMKLFLKLKSVSYCYKLHDDLVLLLPSFLKCSNGSLANISHYCNMG